jgi:tellurium resistance protein TerD
MLNLTKGGSLNLNKDNAPGQQVLVGLGWELVKGAALDLDVMAFILDNAGGKPLCPNSDWLIFFNQKVGPNGSVVHNGDNRTGEGDGDDETMNIDFAKVNALGSAAREIAIFVTIYDARTKGQTFSNLKEAYIRVLDKAGQPIVQYDLDEKFPTAYSVQVGSFIRQADDTWNFSAVGVGFNKDLGEIVAAYGL